MKTDKYYYEMITFAVSNSIPTVLVTYYLGAYLGIIMSVSIGIYQYLWVRKKINQIIQRGKQ